MTEIEYSAITDVGRRRTNNEDNFYADGYYKKSENELFDENHGKNQKEQWLFSVCDGMGGGQYGEIASLMAVQALDEYYDTDFEVTLNEYIAKANNDICLFRREHNSSSMGTTMASLFIKGGMAYISNIGDSRIYLYRGNDLKQLSVDHTEAQGMVDEGIVSPEKARTMKAFHVLTQHLGIFREEIVLRPYTASMKIKRGDIYLLCSDGLTDMLLDNEIKNIIKSSGDVKNIITRLKERALEAGGKDNVTIIVMKIMDVKRGKAEVHKYKDNTRTIRSNRRRWIVAVVIIACILAVAATLAVMCLWGKDGGNQNERTVQSTASPTLSPTMQPEVQPTSEPMIQSTASPTVQPTASPGVKTTIPPIKKPLELPQLPSIAQPKVKTTSPPKAESAVTKAIQIMKKIEDIDYNNVDKNNTKNIKGER